MPERNKDWFAKQAVIEIIESTLENPASSIETLNQGLLNQNFLVTCGDSEKYIVRINKKYIPGVWREHEHSVLKVISQLNFSPKLIHMDISYQFAVFQWLEGKTLGGHEMSVCQHKVLLDSLKQLHSIEVSDSIPCLKSRFDLYYSLAKNVLSESQIRQYRSLLSQLVEYGFFASNTLIHSDLNPKNLIWGNDLKIIDWEFAGRSHPVFDLAVWNSYLSVNLLDLEIYKRYITDFDNGIEIYHCCVEILPLVMKMWEAALNSAS